MLKSTIEYPAQPNKMLMALGILQGYINNPLGFLITTLFTLPGFKREIPPGFSQEFVQANEKSLPSIVVVSVTASWMARRPAIL